MAAIRITMIESGASILTERVRSLTIRVCAKLITRPTPSARLSFWGVMLVKARLASVKYARRFIMRFGIFGILAALAVGMITVAGAVGTATAQARRNNY